MCLGLRESLEFGAFFFTGFVILSRFTFWHDDAQVIKHKDADDMLSGFQIVVVV